MQILSVYNYCSVYLYLNHSNVSTLTISILGKTGPTFLPDIRPNTSFHSTDFAQMYSAKTAASKTNQNDGKCCSKHLYYFEV